ncbi:hypothetical protein BX616_004884 [Lobosporangium transversale]|nr:hypothetical protein BX616_004884 [Lobosporangium transversale]
MSNSWLCGLQAVIPVVVSKKIENPGFGSTSIKANTVSLNDSASYDFSDSQSSKTIFAGRRRLQTARDISRLLKQQWRPGLFALFILAVDMVYSLFYFTAAKKLAIVKPTTPWFTQWTKCLEGQAMISIQAGRLSLTPTADQLIIAGEAAQAACASIAGPYVPSFPWAALAEVMPAILGTIIGLIFGTKVELWQDLRTQLFGNRNSAILTTDGNTKGDRELNLSQAHEHPLDEQYQTKQQRTTKDNDFYSGGLGSDQGFYNSHDILAQSVVHYDNDKLESSMPSSPTTPTSPSPAAGTFRSSLRKGSITIDTIHRPSIGQDIQTPKSMKMTQERAQLVAEGAEPWPAWPSSILHTSRYPNTELESFYSAIPIITSNGIINTTPINAPTQPPSSTERRPSFAMRIQEEKPAADANSATQCQTSASRGFYNSEDLTAGPILQALSRKQSLKTQEMSRQLKQQQQKVQVSTKPPQLEVTIPLRTNSRRDRQVQFQIESEPSQQQLTRTDSILRSPTSPKSANIPTTSPPVPRKSGRRYS